MEILHFRDSDKILKAENMYNAVVNTMQYIEDVLFGTLHRRELLRQALEEEGWRNCDIEMLKVLDGRRYQYKGFKRDVAIDGNCSTYEYILEGLIKLQIGFDKGKIKTGVLMLTDQRSEKSTYGSSYDLAKSEVEMLYPTISMPVSVVLLDLGRPMVIDDKGGDADGIPVSTNE